MNDILYTKHKMDQIKQSSKQRYYQKNKELYKQRVREQRENQKKKSVQNNVENSVNVKTRIDYIFNFYSTLKTEYDFMMWVRNIRRVNKHLFCAKQSDKKGESLDKNIQDSSVYTDCIRSFLKVGERYVSLLPSKTQGVPIFFIIKKIAEEIAITYVNIRFVKCGDGSAKFFPQWENIVRDIVIDDKNLYNIREYSESEKYEYPYYLEIKQDVIAFYKE